MAASPRYKVYSPHGEYVAACKHIEDAACLVALYGEGTEIRLNHGLVLWHEGLHGQPASESYDFVAEVANDRRTKHGMY